MSNKLTLKGHLIEGSKNSFVLLDLLRTKFELPRGNQITGACASANVDGLLALLPSEKADLKMHYFNRDGAEASMCGNGLRCVAYYAKRYFPRSFHVETQRGIRKVSATDTAARVEMGAVASNGSVILQAPDNQSFTFHLFDSGVPHAIVECSPVSHVDVALLGKHFRFHDFFKPAGTNVSFLEQISKQSALIRTYERGVEAETGACGTGAVAAATYLYQKNQQTQWTIIPTSQASLTVYIHESNGVLFAELEGPCRLFGTALVEI